jgi:two-component system, sporulation sensor kinase E
MRKFLEKALEKWEKLDRDSIRRLFAHIAADNELLEMVLHSMTDGVLVTDRDNNILLFNKSAERMIPLASGDIMEKKFWDALEDDELAGFFREKLGDQEIIKDKTFVLGGGVARTISVSIMPLVKEGKIQGNLIHIEDVTEKKINQARLRRAESLAALTTLAAGVAHEIKNPLGSIGIHLQLAQKEMNRKQTIKTKSIKHYLAVIGEEVDRLNRIVVDFLFAVRPMDMILKVIDNGCGIPDSIMDKIFEPYFTTKEFGSGLGLTLVYKIVKEHLGDVTLSSKQGEGTTFILTFSIPQKEKRLLEYEGEEDEV